MAKRGRPRKGEARAARYNSAGKDVEAVSIFVSRHVNNIYLQIQGENVTKHYWMKPEDWERLVSSTQGDDE